MQSIELVNAQGMKVTLANHGARIASILFPSNGELLEMLVSPESIDSLAQDPFYLGATCGPVCSRIANAHFELDGNSYSVTPNDGKHCLHGGANNLSFRHWFVIEQSTEHAVFRLELAHLEDGFPGNREFLVSYHLSEDNKLHIKFDAKSDMDTPISLTNHAYFNLGEENIFDLLFTLSAKTLLERDQTGIPTGQLINTAETGFDTDNGVKIREFIKDNKYNQILQEQGIDHCFVLDQRLPAQASLLSVKNRILLSIYTDQPAMQVYTGTFLSSPYRAYQGICFESQGFTNAVNQPLFPSSVVKKGASYAKYVSYQFSQSDNFYN